jgi:hypothetical protein
LLHLAEGAQLDLALLPWFAADGVLGRGIVGGMIQKHDLQHLANFYCKLLQWLVSN